MKLKDKIKREIKYNNEENIAYIELENVLLDMLDLKIGDEIILNLSSIQSIENLNIGDQNLIKQYLNRRSTEMQNLYYKLEKELLGWDKTNIKWIDSNKNIIFYYKKEKFVELSPQIGRIKMYLKLGESFRGLFKKLKPFGLKKEKIITFLKDDKKIWDISEVKRTIDGSLPWGNLNTVLNLYPHSDINDNLIIGDKSDIKSPLGIIYKTYLANQ